MRVTNKHLSQKFTEFAELIAFLDDKAKHLRGQERHTGGLIYIRVSTDDQKQGYSPTFQKEESLKRLQELGVPFIKDAFFSDEGISGRKIERPGFGQAIKYAIENAETVSHLMVYCSDRYARKAIIAGLSRTFLKGLGIKVCSVTDRMEELSETELVKKEAENEEAAIKGVARTIDGMKRARKGGKFTSMPPYGYESSAPQLIEGKYQRPVIFDPDLEQYARLVLSLALEGKAQHQIREEAAAAGAPMRLRRDKPIDIHTVQRILKNKFYAGLIRLDIEEDIWITGVHKPMITKSQFDRIQVLLGFSDSAQSVPHISDRDDIPLRRFVRCNKCGSAITGSWTENSCGTLYLYYRCYRGCTRSIPGTALHNRFVSELWREAPSREIAMLLRLAIQDIMKKKTERYALERYRLRSELELERHRLFEASNNLSTGVLNKETFTIVQETHLSRIKAMELRRTKLENLEDISDQAVNRALDVICKAPTSWPLLDLESKQQLQQAIFPEGITMTREGELIAKPTPLSQINALLKRSSRRDEGSETKGTCNTIGSTLIGINNNKIQNPKKNDASMEKDRPFSGLATHDLVDIASDSGGNDIDGDTWCP